MNHKTNQSDYKYVLARLKDACSEAQPTRSSSYLMISAIVLVFGLALTPQSYLIILLASLGILFIGYVAKPYFLDKHSPLNPGGILLFFGLKRKLGLFNAIFRGWEIFVSKSGENFGKTDLSIYHSLIKHTSSLLEPRSFDKLFGARHKNAIVLQTLSISLCIHTLQLLVEIEKQNDIDFFSDCTRKSTIHRLSIPESSIEWYPNYIRALKAALDSQDVVFIEKTKEQLPELFYLLKFLSR